MGFARPERATSIWAGDLQFPRAASWARVRLSVGLGWGALDYLATDSRQISDVMICSAQWPTPASTGATLRPVPVTPWGSLRL